MNRLLQSIILPLLLIFAGCDKPSTVQPPAYKEQRIVVDDAVIDAGDYMKIVDPMWWSGDLYDSHENYLASLQKFSLAQRYFYAMAWYEAEVNNGGHEQFYFNSTGIVWKDALEGLRLIRATERAAILEESAKRMGGSPSFNREGRYDQLDKNTNGFADLDTTFYRLEDGFREKLIAYIKDHREEFYFDGMVAKPEM